MDKSSICLRFPQVSGWRPFSVLDEPPASPKRQPPPDIAGKGRILGDIISPASDPDDWEALR